MNFSLSYCEVRKMGNGVNRLDYNYNIGCSELQDSSCKRNLGVHSSPDFSPEDDVRRIVRQANFLLVIVNIAFKYME